MPVPSLVEMASRLCEHNISRIKNIGETPVKLIRPAMLKVQRPDHLHELETNSPHLIGEIDDLWLAMIKRDIPGWDKKPHQPRNPKNWFKVYKKLKAEAQADLMAGSDRLKAALQGITESREKNMAVIVTSKEAATTSQRRKEIYRYDPSKSRTAAGTSVKKMTVFEKLRKQQQEARTSKMHKPTHTLAKKATWVKAAPVTMVEDLRRQQLDPKAKALSKPDSGNDHNLTIKRPRSHSNTPNPSYDVISDREARLKALKTGKPAPKSKPELSVKYLENEDLSDSDEDNELFGGIPKKDKTSDITAAKSLARPLKRKAEPQLFMATKKQMVKPK